MIVDIAEPEWQQGDYELYWSSAVGRFAIDKNFRCTINWRHKLFQCESLEQAKQWCFDHYLMEIDAKKV